MVTRQRAKIKKDFFFINRLYYFYYINKGVSGCKEVFRKTPKDSLPYNIVAKVKEQGCIWVYRGVPKDTQGEFV